MAVENRILALMRMKEWPKPSNSPVMNIHMEQQCQGNKQMDEAQSQDVWQGEVVVSPQPARQYDRDKLGHLSSSINIMSLEDMYRAAGIQEIEQHLPTPPTSPHTLPKGDSIVPMGK
eukprot:6589179-Karenia_brevis.AAC.1